MKKINESIGRDLIGASQFSSKRKVVNDILTKYPTKEKLASEFKIMSNRYKGVNSKLSLKYSELYTKCLQTNDYPKFVSSITGLSKLWTITAATAATAGLTYGIWKLLGTLNSKQTQQPEQQKQTQQSEQPKSNEQSTIKLDPNDPFAVSKLDQPTQTPKKPEEWADFYKKFKGSQPSKIKIDPNDPFAVSKLNQPTPTPKKPEGWTDFYNKFKGTQPSKIKIDPNDPFAVSKLNQPTPAPKKPEGWTDFYNKFKGTQTDVDNVYSKPITQPKNLNPLNSDYNDSLSILTKGTGLPPVDQIKYNNPLPQVNRPINQIKYNNPLPKLPQANRPVNMNDIMSKSNIPELDNINPQPAKNTFDISKMPGLVDLLYGGNK